MRISSVRSVTGAREGLVDKKRKTADSDILADGDDNAGDIFGSRFRLFVCCVCVCGL